MSDYQTEAEPKAWADGVPVFCACLLYTSDAADD